MVFQCLHSKAAGLSLTRGGLTSRLGAAVRSPIGNSSTPRGTGADVMSRLVRRSQVASEHTNSPVSSMFNSESLGPPELNIT